MLNPINSIDQKVFNEQQTLRSHPIETPSIKENGVDSSAQPSTYVERKDVVNLQYDVDRYVRILKNKVIPPEDRFDASILLELELDGKVTAQEVRDMIALVERQQQKRELEKDSSKVGLNNTDDDSSDEI